MLMVSTITSAAVTAAVAVAPVEAARASRRLASSGPS